VRPGAAKGEVGRRALVIDDDAATRELIGTFLEAAGYEVLAADGGEAGIALAASLVALLSFSMTSLLFYFRRGTLSSTG